MLIDTQNVSTGERIARLAVARRAHEFCFTYLRAVLLVLEFHFKSHTVARVLIFEFASRDITLKVVVLLIRFCFCHVCLAVAS